VINLDTLEALASVATSGPWRTEPLYLMDEEGCGYEAHDLRVESDSAGIVRQARRDDAAFIAACREAVPKLIAVARAAKELTGFMGEQQQFEEGSYADRTYKVLCSSVDALSASSRVGEEGTDD